MVRKRLREEVFRAIFFKRRFWFQGRDRFQERI